MQKSLKTAGSNTIFYKPYLSRKEIYSGYFIKSPPEQHFKTEKSWKKRYFVLFEISEQEYQLLYYKNEKKQDRQCGEILFSQIAVLYLRPQKHPKWPWIQKTFGCLPSHVLYIGTNGRDFYLIGEESKEVEKWFSKLIEIKDKCPQRVKSSKDSSNGCTTSEVNPREHPIRKNPSLDVEKQDMKIRSNSDPSSNVVGKERKKATDEENSQKRVSEPLHAIYDFPAAFLPPPRDARTHGGSRRTSLDSLYESMRGIRYNGQEVRAEDLEVEVATNSTMMKSVEEAFHKLKTQVYVHEELTSTDSEDTQPASNRSSSSSENRSTSPIDMLDNPNVRTVDKQSSTESLNDASLEEKNIKVKRADLKKHLSLTEVHGKPSVSGWTGQPQSVCRFLRGDQILAINDIHAGSVEEFNMYLSRSLKSEVKVTILRLHGCPPLYSPNSHCSD